VADSACLISSVIGVTAPIRGSESRRLRQTIAFISHFRHCVMHLNLCEGGASLHCKLKTTRWMRRSNDWKPHQETSFIPMSLHTGKTALILGSVVSFGLGCVAFLKVYLAIVTALGKAYPSL
jgi:hypothetical protein